MKMTGIFNPGDHVIYRVTKHSSCPGPRAKAISASPNGEDYKYQVDKFWVVERVLEDGQLVLRTRRGKTRVVPTQDRNLRSPAWWENLLYRRHFPNLSDDESSPVQATVANGAK
ncbi:hypothetical protein [Planctomicrobium sp. SH527]|uniref:hypothetical protein n=1 Tax=Planctomicrobium sp. SH527 TaxID=3448123 RepID=UPI003F5C1C32